MGRSVDLALAFEDAEPFRLTVDQYRHLLTEGVVEEDARVELIEGIIVRMNAQANVHVFVTFELAVRLRDALRAIGSSLTAVTTPTVALPMHNALEPDIAVTERPVLGPEFLPLAGVRILVEVSHTSLHKDLRFKRDIYARAGVPEYWVVDVIGAEVHRFHRPENGAYRTEPPLTLAGPIDSLTVPDLKVDGVGIL